MSKYKVEFYKGSYKSRQLAANTDDAIVYVEHHFNSGSRSANYAVVIIGRNHSQKSEDIAKDYAKEVANEFNINIARDTDKDPSNDGVFVGGWDGKRGNHNVKYAAMPSVLLEPLFASNPLHASHIRSEKGRLRLAKCLVQIIKKHFPNGGLIAFSVGHKYKWRKPKDRGVSVHGGGNEADYAEKVLLLAKDLLEKKSIEVKDEKCDANVLLHTVKKGDTLWAISKKHNLDVRDLMIKNNLTSTTIEIGQKLEI